MRPLRLLTAVEQVAVHLRSEILAGHWTETMPGVNWLAHELGVNRKTVEAALRQLETDGLLVGQGTGRKRLIVRPKSTTTPSPRLRVGILLGELTDQHQEYIVDLQHSLNEAGHLSFIANKSLIDLKMNVSKVERFTKKNPADAWVVMAAGREILTWFAAQPTPSFALFGTQIGIPIPGIFQDRSPAYAEATKALIQLGHQRIVLLTRRMGGSAEPRSCERAFLQTLESAGIPTGEFNLPVWTETKEGLLDLLTALFQFTPPTAMIVDEPPLFAATQQFLANRGVRVPHHVSLICTDPDPTFTWCCQPIAHISWDSDPIVRRILRWIATTSRGQNDKRQTAIPAEFINGKTIGPASNAGKKS